MRFIKFNIFPDKRSLLSTALITFIIIGSLSSMVWIIYGTYLEPTQTGVGRFQLKRFSSYEELKKFLNTSRQDLPHYYKLLPSPLSARYSVAEGDSSKSPDYSTTNIQVEGVDEADIVKTDGKYIYLASGKRLFIILAYPPEESEVLSKLELNQSIIGIFVKGDRLAVLQDKSILHPLFTPYEESGITIKIYDVINKAAPKLIRELAVDGFYFSSRMIGDYIYIIVNKPAYLKENEVNLPTLTYDSIRIEISASAIYHASVSDYYHVFTTVLAINLENTNQEPSYETFLLGATSDIYVSKKNIYITTPVKEDLTTIHKIKIEENRIVYAAYGNVSGHVLNQFSMDEYEGYFRVATTNWWYAWRSVKLSRNNVYIFDETLNLVGALEGLALGEKIYSARFMEDKCYMVTFRKVDPLFVLDLKNPSNPKVLGRLKLPGYSDYLHIYDEKTLIGIGKETVEAEEGDFSWYQGVKISLFDVSDVDKPKELSKIEIGDRGTDSPALRDHKAFLLNKQKSLLVMPILVAKIDEEQYPNGAPPNVSGEFIWQGAYVFEISLNEGITVMGRITHLEDKGEMPEIGHIHSYSSYVKRALYIGDILYTISDKKIMMNNLTNLSKIGEIELL